MNIEIPMIIDQVRITEEEYKATIRWLEIKSIDYVGLNDVEIPISWLIALVKADYYNKYGPKDE